MSSLVKWLSHKQHNQVSSRKKRVSELQSIILFLFDQGGNWGTDATVINPRSYFCVWTSIERWKQNKKDNPQKTNVNKKLCATCWETRRTCVVVIEKPKPPKWREMIRYRIVRNLWSQNRNLFMRSFILEKHVFLASVLWRIEGRKFLGQDARIVLPHEHHSCLYGPSLAEVTLAEHPVLFACKCQTGRVLQVSHAFDIWDLQTCCCQATVSFFDCQKWVCDKNSPIPTGTKLIDLILFILMLKEIETWNISQSWWRQLQLLCAHKRMLVNILVSPFYLNIVLFPHNALCAIDSPHCSATKRSVSL